MKESLKSDTILAPIPAVMVSCGNMENSNIITIAWTGIINSIPPMCYISVRPTRHSSAGISSSLPDSSRKASAQRDVESAIIATS